MTLWNLYSVTKFRVYVTGLSCTAAKRCSSQNHAPANPGNHQHGHSSQQLSKEGNHQCTIQYVYSVFMSKNAFFLGFNFKF